MPQAFAFLANPAFWAGAAKVAAVAGSAATVASVSQAKSAAKRASGRAADLTSAITQAGEQREKEISKASALAKGASVEEAKKRLRRLSKTVLTSPQGALAQIEDVVAKKTLLGN